MDANMQTIFFFVNGLQVPTEELIFDINPRTALELMIS